LPLPSPFEDGADGTIESTEIERAKRKKTEFKG